MDLHGLVYLPEWLLALLVLFGPSIAACALGIGLALWYTRQDSAATQRAETLLRELLGAEAYQELVSQGYLLVPSPSRPHRTYRIPHRPEMVEVYEEGKLVSKLCIRPVVRVPDADIVLMHKLMIEGNEEQYLRTANHFSPGILRDFRGTM